MIVLSFTTGRPTSSEEINNLMLDVSRKGPLAGLVKVNDLPLVSSDFIHDDASSIFELGMSKVIGDSHATVYAWYDNEWGFANRLLDNAVAFGKLPL